MTPAPPTQLLAFLAELSPTKTAARTSAAS